MQIKETLPAGFSYVDGSATSAQGGVRASTAGQVVTFTVLATSSFTYTVTASDVEGTHYVLRRSESSAKQVKNNPLAAIQS